MLVKQTHFHSKFKNQNNVNKRTKNLTLIFCFILPSLFSVFNLKPITEITIFHHPSLQLQSQYERNFIKQ